MEQEFNKEEATLSAKDEICSLKKKLEEQQRRLDTLRASASGNRSEIANPSLQTAPNLARDSNAGAGAQLPLAGLIGQITSTVPSSSIASITPPSVVNPLRSAS